MAPWGDITLCFLAARKLKVYGSELLVLCLSPLGETNRLMRTERDDSGKLLLDFIL